MQIRDAVKAQIDLASTLWMDNSGSYFVRRDEVDQGTGTVTVSFTTPNGAAATPGAGLRPVSSADRDVTQALFDATGTGAGYAAGDVLARLLVVDVTQSPPTVVAIWVNVNSGVVIASPTAGTYERVEESIGARQIGAWTVGISNFPTTQAVSGPLTDVQLRADPVPVTQSYSVGGGNVDANTQRVVLAADGPTVTTLTQINTAIGAKTDTVAADDTGTYSTIALIKRGLTNWATLLNRIPTLGQKAVGASLPVTLASDQGQMPVFATSCGNLSPITLTVSDTAMAAQVCKRVCLMSPVQDVYIKMGGNDFYLLAGNHFWIEGVGNTSNLSARYVTAAGTLYVHWEA